MHCLQHWKTIISPTQKYGGKCRQFSLAHNILRLQEGTASINQCVDSHFAFVILNHSREVNSWCCRQQEHTPDSKVHGANMGPIWGRQDPDGPHVGPMNFAIWDCMHLHRYMEFSGVTLGVTLKSALTSVPSLLNLHRLTFWSTNFETLLKLRTEIVSFYAFHPGKYNVSAIGMRQYLYSAFLHWP